MANHSRPANSSGSWTSTQAYIFAVICLVVGVLAGYFMRGSGSAAVAPSASANLHSTGVGDAQITPDQLKHMADVQAAPVLNQLKTSPNDPTLLAQAGNVYYDAQVYPEAIDYYKKALAIDSKNSSVRTDMATAMWYQGDPDGAISELNKALVAEPNKAQALFNLGMIKWRAKMDVQGAVADWEKLLKTTPDYSDRARVEELLAQVKQHATIAPGTKSSKAIQ